jgi:hypothetical protein
MTIVGLSNNWSNHRQNKSWPLGLVAIGSLHRAILVLIGVIILVLVPGIAIWPLWSDEENNGS